ncbi:MAG: hypothetical protein ACPL4H_07635 [Anaerolineales bacterium]
MNPNVDEKAHYQDMHASNAFREPRLYPRNWDMSEVPASKNGDVSQKVDGAANAFENESQNAILKADIAFDEWQLNRHLPNDNHDHPEYFAAF